MKIAQTQIEMRSQHLYQHRQSKQESLKSWIGNQRPSFQDDQQTAVIDRIGRDDRVSLSETAIRQYERQSMLPRDPTDSATPLGSGEDPKLTAMRLILEAMTGKKISLITPNGLGQGPDPTAPPPPTRDPQTQRPQPKAGWGLEYDYHEINAEHETMSYSAAGSVETADGRQLDVALDLVMSRDFVETTDLRVRAGDAVLIDPLVINFAGQPPSLSEQKFAFDLNSDGASEQISFLSPGSGLLFLDRNQDGKATDGSELFGPGSNSGFADLTALDSDKNGWLDDNDPMFAKLQLWVKDAVGTDYFAPLKTLDVGAILLAHQATPFSLNDGHNTPLGQITDSGLFLREDGSAGTIQEIRLAV